MIPKLKIIAPKATKICVNGITLYFSYETCIAFSGPSSSYQTATRYSATTNRHKGLMGIKEFQALEESVFQQKLTEELNRVFL